MQYYDINEDDLFDCTWEDFEVHFKLFCFWMHISSHKNQVIFKVQEEENGPYVCRKYPNKFKLFSIEWKSKWRKNTIDWRERVSSFWMLFQIGRRKCIVSIRYVKHVKSSDNKVVMDESDVPLASLQCQGKKMREFSVVKQDGTTKKVWSEDPPCHS